MREVKFRGRCVLTGEWLHGGLIQLENVTRICWVDERNIFSSATIDKKTLAQYTGLKDKNGREIYEGDIVRFVNFDSSGGQRADREITGVIKYQSGLYEIWNNNESEFFESDGAFILNHAWLQDDEFEVIGNIYENPKLLEAK